MKRKNKNILLIALGGTIACVQDGNSLKPALLSEDLIKKISIPKNVTVSFCDSMKRTIIFPEDWISIARNIFDNFLKYDGFVITLGTDTLAYVASALSCMLINLSKPVVLTGAMKPIIETGSDGINNLQDAISLASHDNVGGIFVVFNEDIISGARVSKVRSEDIKAFESINHQPLGRVVNSRVKWFDYPEAIKEKLILAPWLETRVILVKLIPNIQSEFFNDFEKKYKGIVIEGYGDGNISTDLSPVLESLAQKSVMLLASQCPYGKVSHKYEGGANLISAGAISASDMTTEMTLVKLMWMLGRFNNNDKIRKIFSLSMSEIYSIK